MNKIICIEGTDCSGKETQSNLLRKRLEEKGYSIYKTSFPMYDTPTGRVVSEVYLGRTGHGWFSEGATNVDPKAAGLYYAADRLYNMPKIKEKLEENVVILDRYVDSNLAHQGAKIENKEEREKMYEFFETLEHGLLQLPKPDINVLLYMPSYMSEILNKNRDVIDEHESNREYMTLAETAYLEVANRHNYKIINCVVDGKLRTIEDINEELFNYVLSELKK